MIVRFSGAKPDFATVYDSWYSRVYKYAYTLILNREDVEDVTADTFLAAFKQYGSYDPARASMGTWLTRIAHNRAVNLWCAAEKQMRVELSNAREAADPSDFTEGIAAADTVLRLFTRLKPQERELLNLRYTMELRDREIAAMLGLPEKTVNKRFQRLLQKCRMILDGTE